MEHFLTHTFSISNHPVRQLKKPFIIQYVMGLGEFMCYISNSNNHAKLLFDVWTRSILGYSPNMLWNYTPDWAHIKTALNIKRDGIRFFTMRQSFIFDCFYLTESLNPKLTVNAYKFLSDNICGFFTKGMLTEIYNYFQGRSAAKNVSETLKAHRQLNKTFRKKPLKRVLVVATMTAGKSTLINALVGYRINKVKTTVCTSKLCYIYNKPCEDGIIIGAGENKFTHSTNIEFSNSDSFVSAALHFNSTLSGEHICFIDTPGANYSNDTTHGDITHNAIKKNDYDIVLFVANSQYFATSDENKLLDFTIQHTRKPIIFTLNQLDRFKQQDDSIEEMVDNFKDMLVKKGVAPIIIPMSAQAALLMKLGRKKLDEDATFELEMLEKRFSWNYYNLESYVNSNWDKTRSSGLSRTGINLLEKIIKITLDERSRNNV